MWGLLSALWDASRSSYYPTSVLNYYRRRRIRAIFFSKPPRPKTHASALSSTHRRCDTSTVVYYYIGNSVIPMPRYPTDINSTISDTASAAAAEWYCYVPTWNRRVMSSRTMSASGPTFVFCFSICLNSVFFSSRQRQRTFTVNPSGTQHRSYRYKLYYYTS